MSSASKPYAVIVGMMQGRVAMITGSTRGIGKAIALRLADEGARVVVNGRDKGSVARVAGEIEGSLGVAGDMTDPQAVHAICQHVREKFGPIDVVVNNAGDSTQAFFLDSSDDDWDRLLAVNLHGPRQLLAEVIPDMKRQGWGRILNVTSEAGIRGTPGFSAYAASKGALLAMSHTLAAELEQFGIRVNAFAPLALTDLVRSQVSEESLSSLLDGFPTVEECAATALPLVAEDAPNGRLLVMHFGSQPVEVIEGLAHRNA